MTHEVSDAHLSVLRSHRQMFAFAVELSSTAVGEEIRSAARLVVNRLSPLMELSVADGRELSLARTEFLKLIEKLQADQPRSEQT